MRRILRKVLIGERQFGDISTVILLPISLKHSQSTDVKLVGRSWRGGRDHQGSNVKLIQQEIGVFFLECREKCWLPM